MPRFDIDADIRRAHTLSSDFYTDERIFDESKEKLFATSWQFAGLQSHFAEVEPFEILPSFLSEPVLFTKADGRLRCISNVCTHRGKVLVGEPCVATLIRCPYHGRRFALDGKFLSMPEFEGVENFPAPEDDLAAVPHGISNGFVFASAAPAVPFDEIKKDLAELADFKPARDLSLTDRREYEIDAHWALYCENYLEGFHIPYVHGSLNAVIDYPAYVTELRRHSSVQVATDRDGKLAGRYLFLFPNTMFNFYPWGISVNVVRPVSTRRTVVEFHTYVSNESELEGGAGADLHRVEMEDEAVVESVQKGIASRFYRRGRYSPARETGTHHFHRLIAAYME